MAVKNLTADVLRAWLKYDPETGLFTWIKSGPGKNVRVGEVAGSIDCDGYQRISVCGEQSRAHRLAFLYVTGAWPSKFVDHINGDRMDNRFANLRECNNAENGWNRRARSDSGTGIKGVQLRSDGSRYQAKITSNHRTIHLGCFSSIEEAAKARAEASVRFHGEFALVE